MAFKQSVITVCRKLGVLDEVHEAYITATRYRKGQRETIETAGVRADYHLTTNMEYRMLTALQNEEKVMENIIDGLQADDVFYDVGANVGRYTCLAANTDANVVAFEPNPRNVKRLHDNLDLNRGTAQVFEVALSNETGEAELTLVRDNEIGEGGHSLAGGSSTTTVDTYRGDDLIQDEGLRSPTVVKIDVEGAEYAVLQGLEHTLRSERPMLYIEVHPHKLPDFGQTDDDVVDFVTELGYETATIEDRGQGYFIKATVP